MKKNIYEQLDNMIITDQELRDASKTGYKTGESLFAFIVDGRNQTLPPGEWKEKGIIIDEDGITNIHVYLRADKSPIT